jgi:hypothetical protein
MAMSRDEERDLLIDELENLKQHLRDYNGERLSKMKVGASETSGDDAAEAAEVEAPEAEETETAPAMKCPDCDAECPEGATECLECGAEVEAGGDDADAERLKALAAAK